MSGRLWEPVWGDFAAAHEVVAPDLRGHGESRWDGRPFQVEDLADDVVALLDHLGIPTCSLLGMSMGGSVAMVLAARHPERVRRLVLCDTTAWYGDQAESVWAQRAERVRSTPREHQVPFQSDRWFSETTLASNPALVGHAVRIFLRTEPRAHAQACRALGSLDARASLASIRASTLVVTGEQDYATTPQMGRALADAIEGAAFELWPGLRHFAVIESGALRQQILRHLAGSPLPPPPAVVTEPGTPAVTDRRSTGGVA